MRCSPFALSATAALLMWVPVAGADPPCGTADMMTDFHAFIVGVRDLLFTSNVAARPEQAVRSCQYRLFWDQQTFCFSEDDTFMGGVVWYNVVGPGEMTVAEAVDDIDLYRVRHVYLIPEGGAPEDLDVQVTPIQSGFRPDLGHMVYDQHAVFLHLPPGNYDTVLEDYSPDDAADPPYDGCDTSGNCVATVHLRIFSREDAQRLGPSGGFGTVACPE